MSDIRDKIIREINEGRLFVSLDSNFSESNSEVIMSNKNEPKNEPDKNPPVKDSDKPAGKDVVPSGQRINDVDVTKKGTPDSVGFDKNQETVNQSEPEREANPVSDVNNPVTEQRVEHTPETPGSVIESTNQPSMNPKIPSHASPTNKTASPSISPQLPALPVDFSSRVLNILKDAGADSASQQKALSRILELVSSGQ